MTTDDIDSLPGLGQDGGHFSLPGYRAGVDWELHRRADDRLSHLDMMVVTSLQSLITQGNLVMLDAQGQPVVNIYIEA